MSYAGPHDSVNNYRVCSVVDQGFCPDITLPSGQVVSATGIAFSGTVFDGSPGVHNATPRAQLISCTYPTSAFQTPDDVAVLAPDSPNNPFTNIPNSAVPSDAQSISNSNQETYDTLMQQVCFQPASAQNLQSFCPQDPPMSDCLLISCNDTEGYGEACRNWCNPEGSVSSPACSQGIASGCSAVAGAMGGTTSNSEGTKFLDCTCYNRAEVPTFGAVTSAEQQTATTANAKCWFIPCAGSNAAPYLIDANTANASCPSNICSILNNIYANGDITQNQFNESINCPSVAPPPDNGNGPSPPPSSGGGSGGGGNAPPSSNGPSPPTTMTMWTKIGIIAGVAILVLLLLSWLFGRRKPAATQSVTNTGTPPANVPPKSGS
jgi:hypothetical protein